MDWRMNFIYAVGVSALFLNNERHVCLNSYHLFSFSFIAGSHPIVPNTFQPVQFLPISDTEQTPLNQVMTSYYQQQFNVVPYPKQYFAMSKY